MKTQILLLGLLLVAEESFGQSETIIRNRAKELRDQNNVRQGVPPPTQPAQPANSPDAVRAPVQSPP